MAIGRAPEVNEVERFIPGRYVTATIRHHRIAYTVRHRNFPAAGTLFSSLFRPHCCYIFRHRAAVRPAGTHRRQRRRDRRVPCAFFPDIPVAPARRMYRSIPRFSGSFMCEAVAAAPERRSDLAPSLLPVRRSATPRPAHPQRSFPTGFAGPSLRGVRGSDLLS